MSLNCTWGVTAMNDADGPITVGVVHSDYSITELKECLESSVSINQGDKIAQEKANRLVRIVGTISTDRPMLNDGEPIKTRLNWLITIGQQLELFAYNENAAVMITGARFNVAGDLWVKDSV
jgi:hypothetical protein